MSERHPIPGCPDADTLATWLAGGEGAEAGAVAAWRRHAEACPSCREQLAAHEALADLATALPAPPRLAPGFTQRLLSRLPENLEHGGTARGEVAPAHRPRRRAWLGWLGLGIYGLVAVAASTAILVRISWPEGTVPQTVFLGIAALFAVTPLAWFAAGLGQRGHRTQGLAG